MLLQRNPYIYISWTNFIILLFMNSNITQKNLNNSALLYEFAEATKIID